MILFYERAKQWPASAMPKHLQIPQLVGFVSRANPSVLFDASTETIRLPPMIARAEALDSRLKVSSELCVCCQKPLQSPGKTRACYECSRDLKLVMLIMQCQACEKTFERRFSVHVSNLKQNLKEVYCDRNCRAHGRHLRAVEKQTKCKGCGIDVTRNQNEYCSFECYNRKRGLNKYTPKPCLFCGEHFTGRVPKIKTCSESCRRALQVIAIQKTYTEKFGARENRRSLLKYPGSFFAVRDIILARDNARCALCQKKPRVNPMHVHHIDRDRYNNDPKNLISLCQKCHLNGHAKKSFDDVSLKALCEQRNALMPESWRSRASKILSLYSDEVPVRKGDIRPRSRRRAQALIRQT